jgi:hypothetical protein
MNSYCDYKNAFSNKDNDSLEQEARRINNKHSKLQKQVEHEYTRQNDEICKGMDCLMDPANARFAPPNMTSNFSFFSTQGDFASGLPSAISNDNSSNDSTFSNDIKSNSTYSFNSLPMSMSSTFPISESPLSENMESDMSSNYSSLSPKLKKHLRLNTSHLKNYTEKDDKIILAHMKKCEQCKSQLLDLLHINHNIPLIENKSIKSSENIKILENDHILKQNGILNISTSELKDMLILILIGTFVIILLDMFIR